MPDLVPDVAFETTIKAESSQFVVQGL